jgi:hypothetical protein
MTQIRSLAFRAYSTLPLIFFSMVLACYGYSELAWGGISWRNHAGPGPTGYEVFNPWFDAILFPTVLGMLALPLLFAVQLFINAARWRRWVPAILAYAAFLAFAVVAAHMGWYID